MRPFKLGLSIHAGLLERKPPVTSMVHLRKLLPFFQTGAVILYFTETKVTCYHFLSLNALKIDNGCFFIDLSSPANHNGAAICCWIQSHAENGLKTR